ncbi:FGGY-family carbohydrate kinase [Escherichia coli]
MGLWLLQRVLQERQIRRSSGALAATQALPACRFIIDPNDDRFINPETMCSDTGCVWETRNQSRKVMLNWRAVSTVWHCCMPMCCMSWRSYAVKISRNCILSAAGCQNTLLNQLCADACGIRVIAGPVEASTLGNIEPSS